VQAETGRRGDVAAALAIFASLGAVYVWSAPRTVTLEDVGLFLVTADSGGIAHPPGYPLYLLVAHAFSALPIESPALRIHLVSMLCGAGAGVALFACGRRLGASHAAAAAAALAFGLSRTFWSQALVAEVYALHVMLLFTLLALCLGLDARFSRGRLLAASVVAGLALANHWPLTLLAGPAFAVVLWPRWRELLRALPVALAGLLLGLLPYLHLFAASRSEEVITAFGPVEGLADLWWYLSLGSYRGSIAAQVGNVFDLYAFVNDFFDHLWWELSPLGFGLALAGLAWLWTRGPRRMLLALALGILSSSLLFRLVSWGTYSNLAAEQYRTVQVGAFGFFALTTVFAERWLRGDGGATDGRRRAAVWSVGLAVVASTFALHVGANQRREERFAAEYARLVLESLPPDATLLLADGTDTGPVAYLHRMEGVRPDVTLYSQAGALFPNRLFDPQRVEPEAAGRVLARFAEEHPDAFVTFASPLLASALPGILEGRAGGVLTRLGPEPTALPLSDQTLRALEGLLDRELAGGNGAHWSAHRERILWAACASLLRAGRRHAAMEELPYCAFASASHAYANGQLRDARRVLDTLLARADLLDLSPLQWHVAHLRHLDATLALHELGEDVPLQEAIDRAHAGLAFEPSCRNRIAPVLARVHRASGGRLRVDLPRIERTWGSCPAVAAALADPEPVPAGEEP